ncbi:putative receptor-like protein kinase [Acorus gramineus]|uniref:RING-type E3 ubiquitin transferase n=1 Tax=Acorus gramineus TaxID=55184 RepID=A0AAV9BYF0_ACOGR|nr:putative receptor-like protein kinase [Acorus gramineus]
MSWWLFIFIIFHLLCSTKGENVRVDDFFKVCQPSQCGDKGPLIRFPFRLDSQPSSCGLKGQEVSCSGSTTLLNLPSGGNLSVRAINYTGRFITTNGGDSWSECPLQGLLSLNFTNSVFSPNLGIFSLVSCPTNIPWTAPEWIQQYIAGPITCLSNAPSRLIYLAAEFVSVDEIPNVCAKFSDVKSNGYNSLYSNLLVKQCNFSCTVDKLRKEREVVLTGTVLVIASILFVVIYITRRSVKEKELRLKIETFLTGYNTTKPTRYTLTELRKITKKVEVEGNDREIAKKLAIVALWCVQCNPADRPSMTRVIHMIEGDLQSLSMPPNPFA